MRRLSPREQWLVALCVPALLPLIYFGHLRVDQEDRIVLAESRLTKAAIPDEDRDLSALTTELVQLEHDRPELDKQLEQRVNSLADPANRTALLRKLSDSLLARRDVTLLRSTEVGAGEPAPVPRVDLCDALRELTARGAARPALWRLDVRGNFAALRGAVERFLAVEGAYTPISLALHPTPNQRTLDLSLWVWL